MKHLIPDINGNPQIVDVRSFSDVPNSVGFRCLVVSGDARNTIPAVVAKDENGCHFLRALTGEAIFLPNHLGWIKG